MHIQKFWADRNLWTLLHFHGGTRLMGRVGMNRVAVVLLGNDSNLGRELAAVLFILSSCPQSGSF